MAQKWLFAPCHNSNTHRPYSRVYYQEQSSFVGIDKKRFHRVDEKTVVYGIELAVGTTYSRVPKCWVRLCGMITSVVFLICMTYCGDERQANRVETPHLFTLTDYFVQAII